MNKTKKILALALVAVLICAASVAGTVAYLKDEKKNAIINTFTVGELFDNGGITLTEHEISANSDGTYSLTATKTQSGNQYKSILPGTLLPKDPAVELTNLDADVYIYLAVRDTLAETAATGSMTWTMHNNWLPLKNGTEQITCKISDEDYKVYVYSTDGSTASVVAPTASLDLQIINGETVGSDTNWQGIHVSPDYQMTAGAAPALKFCTMICQSKNFTDALDAWNNCFGASL